MNLENTNKEELRKQKEEIFKVATRSALKIEELNLELNEAKRFREESNKTRVNLLVLLTIGAGVILFLLGGIIWKMSQINQIKEKYEKAQTKIALLYDSLSQLNSSKTSVAIIPIEKKENQHKNQGDDGQGKLPNVKAIVISIATLAGGAELNNVSAKVEQIKNEIKKINKYKIEFSNNEQDSSIRLSLGFSDENPQIEYYLERLRPKGEICKNTDSPQSLSEVIKSLVECIEKSNLE